MAQEEVIRLFDSAQIRVVWDSETEKYYFSVVDVIQVLTDSENPQTYWRVLKKRLKDEGNETVTNCNALKLTAADGKKRLGRSVISSRRAVHFTNPQDELPLPKPKDESDDLMSKLLYLITPPYSTKLY